MYVLYLRKGCPEFHQILEAAWDLTNADVYCLTINTQLELHNTHFHFIGNLPLLMVKLKCVYKILYLNVCSRDYGNTGFCQQMCRVQSMANTIHGVVTARH